MAYKGYFYTGGLTFNVSANDGNEKTEDGHGDFSMMMAGVASEHAVQPEPGVKFIVFLGFAERLCLSLPVRGV